MTKDKDTPEMRILKKATCDTISGKSKLTYHIGATPESEIHFRIYSNTGGGFFSQEYVSLKDILDVFDEAPKGQPITSFVLQPVNLHRSLIQ